MRNFIDSPGHVAGAQIDQIIVLVFYLALWISVFNQDYLSLCFYIFLIGMKKKIK